MQTKFSEIPLGQFFNYNGARYIKDRPDRAQIYPSQQVRERFPANYMVDYDAPAPVEVKAQPRGDWHEDPATQNQLNYLIDLGVNVGREHNLTKGLASRIIDAVKRGDGVGQFGLTMIDGSN